MKDQQLLLAVVLFLLLSSIPPNYQGGKRGRKAIMKSVKKPLSIYSREDKERYLLIVSAGEDCMHLAREQLVNEIGERGYQINPGMLLRFLEWKYADLMSISSLKKDHVDNMDEHYMNSGIGFASIKYGNKVVEHIRKYAIPNSKITYTKGLLREALK